MQLLPLFPLFGRFLGLGEDFFLLIGYLMRGRLLGNGKFIFRRSVELEPFLDFINLYFQVVGLSMGRAVARALEETLNLPSVTLRRLHHIDEVAKRNLKGRAARGCLRISQYTLFHGVS